jgi:undecaprenyl-diphosphooligosaccharide--protein glycosyltransferase
MDGIIINKTDGMVMAGASKVPLESIDIVQNGEVKSQELGSGRVKLIILADSGVAILADDEIYNSAYIQMFALNHYDSKLFELVVSTPKIKIFKLKI